MVQSVNKIRAAALAIALLLIAALPANSQQTSVAALSSAIPTERVSTFGPTETEAILTKFIAAEAEVREALNQHTFKRDVVLQTIGPNGEVTGEYIRNSQFVFDNRGRRIERVLFHPKSTISEMRITKEDVQDLAGAQLLGIDVTEASKYRLVVLGMEAVDQHQLIAIEVIPLTSPDPHRMSDRFFVGRVWLDPSSFQIVKVKGIVEPQGKQRFPLFETWRDALKGQFAFPTRTEADDVLHFRARDVHYRIKVRYYDYQMFGSRVTVKDLDEAAPEADAQESRPATDKPKTDSPKNAPKSTPLTRPAGNTPTSNIAPIAPKASDFETCTTNRTAPPVGPYYWPADTEVKVYFMRNVFDVEQRAAILEAMATWTVVGSEIGSGIKFIDAGETDDRQPCSGCLTIRRNNVYKQDKHHYAFFYPMNRVDRLLVSAWIDLDFGITKPDALKGFMVHELGHGLGLWDCTSCKKKQTIMNGFPGLNKNNGLTSPSTCDVATVKNVYHEERHIARSNQSGSSNGIAAYSAGFDAGASSSRLSEQKTAPRHK
jgi:predicted Zn-dependent protease